jgi:hypothetical protein
VYGNKAISAIMETHNDSGILRQIEELKCYRNQVVKNLGQTIVIEGDSPEELRAKLVSVEPTALLVEKAACCRIPDWSLFARINMLFLQIRTSSSIQKSTIHRYRSLCAMVLVRSEGS